jgi:hypothetical protein
MGGAPIRSGVWTSHGNEDKVLSTMLRVAGLAALGVLAVGCKGERGERAAAAATPTASSITTASPPPGVLPPTAETTADSGSSAPSLLGVHPGAYANNDPSDDLTVGPPDVIADCEGRLASAGVTGQPASIPVHQDRGAHLTCGAPQVVTYARGPGHIAYVPAPVVTCGMALALASYERILQEEAERVFQSPIVRIEQIGTYNCRGIVRFKGVVSEHSYANAIDLTRFMLKNGKVISVLNDFDSGEGPPAHSGGAFLRAISQRAQDEDVFSNVLTPFWDAAHKNHFHLDLARYRVDGVRPAPR